MAYLMQGLVIIGATAALASTPVLVELLEASVPRRTSMPAHAREREELKAEIRRLTKALARRDKRR
jgi:hypothetical protein